MVFSIFLELGHLPSFSRVKPFEHFAGKHTFLLTENRRLLESLHRGRKRTLSETLRFLLLFFVRKTMMTECHNCGKGYKNYIIFRHLDRKKSAFANQSASQLGTPTNIFHHVRFDSIIVIISSKKILLPRILLFVHISCFLKRLIH
jgi:hypothetical protein